MRKLTNLRKKKPTRYVYSQEDINKVLYNLPPLPEIVSEYVILKKRTYIHTGSCPFCRKMDHNDKHFIVSEKGFKCFYCGVGGTNAFGFYMRYFNEPFDKVLNKLNNKYLNLDITPKFIKLGEDYYESNLPF